MYNLNLENSLLTKIYIYYKLLLLFVKVYVTLNTSFDSQVNLYPKQSRV